jgi:hypothetical protein
MNYIDILNSTFVNNHVNTGGGAINNGSGLYRFSLTNVTMAGNSATAGAGGIYNYNASSGSLTYYFKNNLIANNSGSVNSDVYVTGVTMNNNGYNLVENSNYTFNATGDITGDQANLFGTGLSSTPILGNHGTLNGTKTIELLSGSVAINAGASGVNGDISVSTTDQRGMNRNGSVDIGAYEYGGTSGTASWTGGASTTSWATTGNWSGGVVPNSGYAVTIPGSLSYYPVIDDSYTASNPASCMNLTIENGASVAINPGKAFTVNGTLTNSGGNPGIIIQSSADGTGSLIHNSDDIAATVKTYITGSTNLEEKKFHLVSIPAKAINPTSGLFLGSYLYKLDATQQEASNSNYYGKWVALGTSTSTPLDLNQGYMVYYPGASTTYTFPGNLNNSDFSFPITGHTGTYTFNLVPNPYPSAVNWGAATGWTKSAGIGGTCYVWGSNSGNYEYIPISGSPGIIPVGQAFMVMVNNEASPILTVKNAARVHSSQAFYKSAEETSNQLSIKADANSYSDVTRVAFNDEATEDFDLQTDGMKIFGLEDAPQLYTLSADKKFSINNLPLFQDQRTIEMNFETQFTGQVNLIISGIENFDPSLSIYLKDELTNQTINLRNQSVYTFVHNPENAANRFKLVFGGTIGIDEPTSLSGNLWIAGNTLYLNTPNLAGQTGLVEVYNVSGQKLMSKTIGLNELSMLELNYKGFIIVKLTAANEVMTVKGILR